MSNIIDKIQLSGVTYDIGGQGGSGVSVVEVTQAVYDALPSSAKTDTSKMYVITDAEAGDLTNYYTKTETNTLLGGKADTATTYTKTEVDNAITAATSTKQDTLVSGTNIKTINSQSLLGSGNIVIQGGSGGGKAIEAGRGISITTGETADTVSFNLPISAGTGTNSVIFGNSNNKANGQYSHAEGANTTASGNYSHAEGLYTTASGSSSHAEGGATTASGESSHAEGFSTNASGNYSHAEGYSTLASGGNGSHAEGYQTSATSLSSHAEGGYNSTSNSCEHASGRYNITTSASTTFGDSGNTLFSVGNGTSSSARHNAFEIRQNGDIYISSGGTDIKLQDHLGGGGASYTPGDGIDITNNVISVTGKVDTTTYNTYTAATDTALASKQTTLTAGTNITIVDNVISATGGGGGGGTVETAITSGSTNAVESKAIWSATTYNKDILLTFNGNNPINYPSGCKKFVVTAASNTSGTIMLYNGGSPLSGYIFINNFGSPTVAINGYEGITYTISGNDVTFVVPDTITFDQLFCDSGSVIKAIVEGAWIADNTYTKEEVDGIQYTLQNNINQKLDSTAYTPVVIDSALNVASTNPLENQALYPELRISNEGETETTLTFENDYSTNYVEGCTKIKVEVIGSGNGSTINFYNDNQELGNVSINNWGFLNVNNTNFQAASYEISGTTVIISYPTITNVTKIKIMQFVGNYTYKAVTTEPPTVLKNQVIANTTALGGLKLVKLTESQYTGLVTKDESTLYVVIPDPNS